MTRAAISNIKIRNRKTYKFALPQYIMENDTISVPRSEYEELRKLRRVDTELLTDIANGIKDILQGKVKEV